MAKDEEGIKQENERKCRQTQDKTAAVWELPGPRDFEGVRSAREQVAHL